MKRCYRMVSDEEMYMYKKKQCVEREFGGIYFLIFCLSFIMLVLRLFIWQMLLPKLENKDRILSKHVASIGSLISFWCWFLPRCWFLLFNLAAFWALSWNLTCWDASLFLCRTRLLNFLQQGSNSIHALNVCFLFRPPTGVRIFIEKKAQLSLLGTEMDFVETKLSSEFVFNNPNIKGTCGCGESFNI